MHLPISGRLLACCNFIAPGARVADIGCDHGYLGIHLLKSGLASSVIAADVREKPLQSAMANALKYGVQDRMRFFLSDGAVAIPRDFDTMVCAGMGGDTIIHILSHAPWLRDARYRLVLQCQTRPASLRRYLSQNGWRITEETVLRDGHFLYTVMEVYFEPGCVLTAGQCYFPPAILENPSPETAEYFRRVLKKVTRDAAAKEEAADALLVAAAAELTALADGPALSWLKEETI